MTDSSCDAWIYHCDQNFILVLIAFLPEPLFFAVGVIKSDFLTVWNVDIARVKVLELTSFSPHPYGQGRRS